MNNLESRNSSFEANFIAKFTYFLEDNNFDEIRNLLKENPNYKEKIPTATLLPILEDFFIEHLSNAEESDFDLLHKVVNLSVCPLEELKKDTKIIEALVHAVKDFQKEHNNNALSRIRNLEILEETNFGLAA